MLQIISLSKNLLLLIDMNKNDKVGIIGSSDDEKNVTVKKSPLKNLNKATRYLTLKARLAFTKLKKVFIKALIL